MIERIRQLLNDQELTAAAFADKLGVPRSTISHILSGRNKPSLEMVYKILDSFPDLRTEWLVRGQGLMYTYHTTPRQGDLFSHGQQKDIGDDDRPADREGQGISSQQDVPDDRHPDSDTDPMSFPHAGKNESADAQPDENTSVTEKSAGHSALDRNHKSPKAVEKIIILYQDGTFMDYVPANT